MLKTLIAAIGFACVAAPMRTQTQSAPEMQACKETDLKLAAKLSQSEEKKDQAKAVTLYQEYLRCIGSEHTKERLDTEIAIGKNQYSLAHYEEARASFSAALETLRQINSQDHMMEAEIWLDLGRAQSWLDDQPSALLSFTSALETLQRLADQNATVREHEAAALVNRARIQASLGRVEKAMFDYRQALELFRSADVKSGEAYALGELCLANLLLGDHQSALEHCALALSVRNSIDSSDVKNQQGKAAIFDLMGRVHTQMNDPEQAMLYFQKALSIARKTKYHHFVALTLNDIGVLRLKQNQPSTSEGHHQQALQELMDNQGEPNAIAETRALLGDAQTAQGKYDLALENYHGALALQEEKEDTIGQAQTHFSMGMLQSKAHLWPQARESLARAVELYRRAHHRVGESNARFQNAAVMASQGNETEAKREVEQAIQLAEEVRNFTPGVDLRASYFASVEQMYQFQIDLLLKNDGAISDSNQLEAFALLQRIQSRALIDTLGSRMRASLFSSGDPSVQSSIEDQDRQLAGFANSKIPSALVEATFEETKKLEASLKETEAKALDRQPTLGFFSNIVSLSEIQQRVLDPASALVQFYLSEPHSHAWIITKSTIDFVRLPSKKALERNVRQTLQFGPGGKWTGLQRIALGRLRQNLAPVFAAARAKRWIVVPDGGLHYFPFMALAVVPGQKHGPQEIVKVPSVSTVDIVRRTKNANRPAYALIAFGDPVFDNLDSRVTGLKSVKSNASTALGVHRAAAFGNGFMPRLIYSLKEVEAISQLFPPNQTRRFLDFAASREAASGNALQDFEIIHLATHSLTNERHPELSRIVFSRVAQDGSPRPGNLFAKDIYQMKLSADLVVLSSCQSALGRQQPGEGPMSLSRAFLFAGSKAVVASLWEVNDEATAELMQRFYRHMLKDKLPPSGALAMAQSEFRRHRDKKLRDPYYWAGFELYGEWLPFSS